MSKEKFIEYKDSEIDWIGEIPVNWKLKKLKHILKERNVKNNPIKTNEILSLTIKQGVIPLSEKEYIGGNKQKDDLTQYKLAFPNDIVLNSMNIISGAVGLSKHYGCVSPVYYMFYSDNDNINIEYYNYIFQIKSFQRMLLKFGKGILIKKSGSGKLNTIRMKIPMESFKELELPVFDIETQNAIVKFLNHNVSIIDKQISKSEELIQLLEEKRVSLINQVVTKGLNPNVSMKDSGVEWIGNIPKHWSLTKFRNVLKERMEKNNPIKSKERLSLSIDKGVTLYSEKTTNLDRFKDDFTQYKLAHEGDLVLNSMNMIVGAVGVSKYFGCVSPVYYTYYDETQNHTTTTYCDYLFKTKTIKKYLRSLGRGIMSIDRGDDRINTCRLKVSRDDLRNMFIPYPPLNEQKEINAYLDKECENITKINTTINKHIGLLEEYKTSLIHNAVTGKISVPIDG